MSNELEKSVSPVLELRLALTTGQYERLVEFYTVWEFRDSDGHLHRGENRVVDMIKTLDH
jgi:hypothetical protein